MVEIHKFVANDGVEFGNSRSCKMYEALSLEENQCIYDIKCYDEFNNRIYIDEDTDFLEIFKIVITTDEQAMALQRVTSYIGEGNSYLGITTKGIWKYIDKFDSYINIDEYMEEYVAQIKWERDTAIEQLKDIGISFGSKYENIINKLGNDTIGMKKLFNLIQNGNVQIIQTGGFDE